MNEEIISSMMIYDQRQWRLHALLQPSGPQTVATSEQTIYIKTWVSYCAHRNYELNGS